MSNDEFSFRVLERYGILSEIPQEDKPPQKKILQLVKWGYGTPKFDIRLWSNFGTAHKGITLTFDEMRELQKIIRFMDIDDIEDIYKND